MTVLQGPPAGILLRTLGVVGLLDASGAPIQGLRRKDIALLVYLCLEGPRVHSRSRLASILWGESPEARARHSLTQSLRRIHKAIGPEMVIHHDAVEWKGTLACDVLELERVRSGLAPATSVLTHRGEFMPGFSAGDGAEDFELWADERRVRYRNIMVQFLDRLGADAEQRAAWDDALDLGQRAVALEPIFEEGHRRMMRAWTALGERGQALRHYQRFESWMRTELEEEPDPMTEALARSLRAEFGGAERQLLQGSATSEVQVVDGARERRERWLPQEQAFHYESSLPVSAARKFTTKEAPHPESRPAPRTRLIVLLAILFFELVFGTLLLLGFFEQQVMTVETISQGEHFTVDGSDRVYLSFGARRWEYPDRETVLACTNQHPDVIRRISAMPQDEDAGKLLSVREHPWIAGNTPVRAENDTVIYVLVGCVTARVTEADVRAEVLTAAGGRVLTVRRISLNRLPAGPPATRRPRPSGTVIRSGTGMRWITYMGGALRVPSVHVLASHCTVQVQDVDQTEFEAYAIQGLLRPGDGKCEPQQKQSAGSPNR